MAVTHYLDYFDKMRQIKQTLLFCPACLMIDNLPFFAMFIMSLMFLIVQTHTFCRHQLKMLVVLPYIFAKQKNFVQRKCGCVYWWGGRTRSTTVQMLNAQSKQPFCQLLRLVPHLCDFVHEFLTKYRCQKFILPPHIRHPNYHMTCTGPKTGSTLSTSFLTTSTATTMTILWTNERKGDS